ncbi:hypothetical protein chiPu_0003699 [Chiloscyllium punctatum]|uniref:Uncharacterized protein n=1 Tax=Chiloscyllium punctatum TaxID=137246 RepID=A0A401S4G0_CHIPU|nr:hypothetical protein [Chiloscyllium punctatum]
MATERRQEAQNCQRLAWPPGDGWCWPIHCVSWEEISVFGVRLALGCWLASEGVGVLAIHTETIAGSNFRKKLFLSEASSC